MPGKTGKPGKTSKERKNNVLKGHIKIKPADIFTDFDSLPNKAKKNVSRAVTEINGVFLKSAAKNMSPVSFNIDQADTPFCVACSNARVIVYKIIKYYSTLSPDDIEMLYKFYIYCQTKDARQISISLSWLELFINQLNQNSIRLMEIGEKTISLGYHVTAYNKSVFTQGQDPSSNESYTERELKVLGIDIDRLYEILNTCAEYMASSHIHLKLKSINGGPNIIQYLKDHPNTQHAILSFFVGNKQILENPPRDGDITNAFRVSNEGHAMFLYKIIGNNLMIKNSYYFNSNGPPTITNNGETANMLIINLNKIDPNSIRHLILLEEVSSNTKGGFTKKIKTRKYRKRQIQTKKQNKLK
jgi:hypothetical protein